MSNLNEEDIARMLGDDTIEITYKVDVKVLLDEMEEWKNLVEELSNKEVLLYKKKEAYQVASDKIIAETDFKALFGKNNADVRKQYVKEQLRTEHETIKALEFSIDWINRRIVYLKELIRVKRVLMEVKQ